MFYVDAVLQGKGALAKVWLAAHMERKLSKQQALTTSIPKSVKAIEQRPLALRLSGFLLLGLVRIYARHAKYLLDDCSDVMVALRTVRFSGRQ
jgi:cohesin complex subunit SCC1